MNYIRSTSLKKEIAAARSNNFCFRFREKPISSQPCLVCKYVFKTSEAWEHTSKITIVTVKIVPLSDFIEKTDSVWKMSNNNLEELGHPNWAPTCCHSMRTSWKVDARFYKYPRKVPLISQEKSSRTFEKNNQNKRPVACAAKKVSPWCDGNESGDRRHSMDLKEQIKGKSMKED